MSVCYYDAAVAFFSKRGEWMRAGRINAHCVRLLKEAVRKSRTFDPELVLSITGLSGIRQALFNICSKVHCSLSNRRKDSLPAESTELLQHLTHNFDAARGLNGGLDVEVYIRSVASRLTAWISPMPLNGRTIAAFELVDAFKNLLAVYSNFSGPVLRTRD
jgi:hypothetical protein